MKILDRYIIKTMAFYTLAVMLIWLGVYSFFSFLNEVNDIGQANYTVIEADYLYFLKVARYHFWALFCSYFAGIIIGIGSFSSNLTADYCQRFRCFNYEYC